MKNLLEGLTTRLTDAENQISELDDELHNTSTQKQTMKKRLKQLKEKF